MFLHLEQCLQICNYSFARLEDDALHTNGLSCGDVGRVVVDKHDRGVGQLESLCGQMVDGDLVLQGLLRRRE